MAAEPSHALQRALATASVDAEHADHHCGSETVGRRTCEAAHLPQVSSMVTS
jgi:hypothetical protein